MIVLKFVNVPINHRTDKGTEVDFIHNFSDIFCAIEDYNSFIILYKYILKYCGISKSLYL